MEVPPQLIRPSTLEVGKEYLLMSGRDAAKNPVLIPVKFAGYDPCPAFIIVQNELGRVRCARDDLFQK